jgi:hypothetical protein
MAEFGTSGLSVRAFCLARSLSKSSFYAWRGILAEGDAATSQPAFLPVTIQRPSSAAASAGLSLELRSGRVLRFGDALPAERIAAIVEALEAAEVRS